MAFSSKFVQPADVPAVFQELAGLYFAQNVDPATVVVCPQDNHQPIPTQAELERHVADPRLDLLEVRDDGQLVMLVLMLDKHRVRAGWGPANPQLAYDATFQPGGAAEFVHDTIGRPYAVDTGMRGWVVRQWFERHLAQTGPYNTAATDHPGLAPQVLSEWDEEVWKVTMTRTDPASPWTWVYEKLT